jgi:hypothetical protein
MTSVRLAAQRVLSDQDLEQAIEEGKQNENS